LRGKSFVHAHETLPGCLHSVAQHRPRKRFGQHFLADPSVVDAIAAAVNPMPQDVFVEIGPGEGVLTARMLAAVDHLHAIEIDRDLVARLRRSYREAQLTLIEGDALAFDFSTLPAKLRVIGNLPYNISTELMFHLCDFAGRFVDMHFMLQKEVVERMAAKPSTPEYGRLSIMTQYWFAVSPLFTVPPEAFRPPPKVESMIVRLTPRTPDTRAGTDVEQLRKIVTAAFSKRRKTLKNSLAGLISESELTQLGLHPADRAENLSLDDYLLLCRHLLR